ncbi:O-antigen ligase family protein [Pseudoxanthomonas koreensis]|uniref:O-antigen ligase family protein n=1 Tax=Pseudoxanthomonas koreensis TaxID=266061 RepID=UPI001390DF39|nr:O-antigen ligase family protein [Pseudoxanthomonas koreensis]KAF1690739.1 hypothetical protein CSC64_10925 [Pseudoxanthomonas koreensis]
MPNWPAEHDPIHSRAFAWTPYWVLAFVALWPLPGSAEGMLALGALAVLVQLAVTVAKGRTLPLDRGAAWLAAALFAVYWLPELLSAPDALDRGRAWKEVAADLRYLPFLWGVGIAVHTARGRRVVFAGIAAIAAAWTVDALLQAAFGTSPLFWSLDTLKRAASGEGFCSAESLLQADRLGGVFGSCNLKLGLVLASLSPLVLAAAARRQGAAGWSLAAVALGIAILLGGARASWLTYALVLAFTGRGVLGGKRLLAFAATGVLAMVAMYALSPQLQQRVARTTLVVQADGAGVDGALSGRTRIWQGALCMAREHPFNGVGVRGFRGAWPACDPAPGEVPAWGGGEAYHAHQLLLELLSETGVLGLLLWLAGVWLVWRSWRDADAIARVRARPALLALAVTAFPVNTHLAFYSTFWGGVVVLLAGLYIGALYGRETDTSRA